MGNDDATAPGRSMGSRLLKPQSAAPSTIRSGPSVSAPIWAKAVLHDTTRIWTSAPPQVPPPKFCSGVVEAGGTYPLEAG